MNKILLYLVCFFTINVFALSLSPIDLEIDASKAQGYYTLINDGVSKKVIAITAKTRMIDEDGKSHYGSTKDLIIYPKQVLLKPKEKRLIRIIWKAKEKITCEKNYRITFAEQNVDIDFGEEELGSKDKRAGVSFGVRFDGSIYIQPNNKISPNIEVSSYRKKRIEGENYFVITLENTGLKHKRIKAKELELELLVGSNKSKESWHLLSEGVLKKAIGDSAMILAGGKRCIKIPCRDKEIPENVLGVRITE